MIEQLEYITEQGGVTRALRADKNVKEKNAWHLATIKGTGFEAAAIGEQSHGIAGRSYNGLDIDAREIEADLYADGYDMKGCQKLLGSVSSFVTPANNEALGVLRLTNAAGDAFRIAAKCVEFGISKTYRRAALCSAVFHCPFNFFESDVLHVAPLFAITGGKEYPLERPFTFGEIADAAAQTIEANNEGDMPAPCIIKLTGAGLSRVEVKNETTGAGIIVSGMDVSGIEICTDENNLYARFEDGADASAYISLFSEIAAFKLAPGVNVLSVTMDATNISPAGTQIEWRGRFSTCL